MTNTMFGLYLVGTLLVPLYLLTTLVDQLVAIYLEKKNNLYPMIDFECFCGFKIKLLSRWMVPIHLYRYYKLQHHMKGCLQWILNVDMNGLTPYWGHSYAGDLRNGDMFSGILTKEYFLKEAKRRSDNVKAGRSPWFEPDPTKAASHGEGDQI